LLQLGGEFVETHGALLDGNCGLPGKWGSRPGFQVAIDRAQAAGYVPIMDLETWELLSYVVTVVGLPLAISVFVFEQRKERDNEEEEVYQLLSDNYQDFLKVALEHSDLRLFSTEKTGDLDDIQRERMYIVFSMLISLFERAYLLLYEDDMTPKQWRRWRSWEDYMREWCQREDFRTALAEQLGGEDPDFVSYLQRLAEERTPS
jgi:hypothetical protein